MEIGKRLKEARTVIGLTQEKVAEEIGVSRQSISNWENNRSYPDIVSVIKLSDLYSVSLDELLKEDKNMIRHLAESSNAAISREKLFKRIIIAAYCAFWALVLLYYWLIGWRIDAFAREWRGCHNEQILFLFVFPLCVAVIAGFMGACKIFGRRRWLFVPISGALLVFLNLFTAELCDFINIWFMNKYINVFEMFSWYFRPINLKTWVASVFLFGCGGCAAGMFVGSFIRYYAAVREKANGEETVKNK